MTSRQDVELCIVGGGCAAIWIGYYAAQLGLQVVIVAENPAAGFGSTRNQGWLHSGALYAAYDLDDVARQCRDATKIVESICPEAISQRGSYFVVRGDRERERVVSGCVRNGLWCNVPSRREVRNREHLLSHLVQSDPELRCVETSDRVVDTTMLLTTVLRHAAEAVEWVSVGTVTDLEIGGRDGGWTVRLPSGTDVVTARALVLAAGPAIPQLLRRAGRGQDGSNLRVATADVLVVPAPLTRSLVATLFMAGPSVVPFGSGPNAGVTVTIAGADTVSAAGDTPPDGLASRRPLFAELPAPYRDAVAELGLRGQACPVYRCSKLVLADHPSYHGDLVSRHDDRLFTIYPRKFTSAPISAWRCAIAVRDSLSGSTGAAATRLRPAERQLPRVSTPPYRSDGR
jgi:glycine/D-amino acid oxidase-like deaminating enzyme